MFDLMMQAVLVLSAGALGTCAISDMFSRDVLSRAGRHGRYADLNDFPAALEDDAFVIGRRRARRKIAGMVNRLR